MSYVKKAKRIEKMLQSFDPLLYTKVEYNQVKVLLNGVNYVIGNPVIGIYRKGPLVDYFITKVLAHVSEIWLYNNFREADMQRNTQKYHYMNNMLELRDRERAKWSADREADAAKEFTSFAHQRSYFTF